MDAIKRKLAKIKKEELLSMGAKFKNKESSYSESTQAEFEACQQAFQLYLESDSEEKRYSWVLLHKMDEWHRENSRMIALVEDKQEIEHLAHSAHYGYWWLKLGPDIAIKTNSPGHVAIQEVGRNLSDLILIGQYSLAKDIASLINQHLKPPYMLGDWEYYPHAFFLLDLSCRWQGFELDTSGCDYLPDMLVYKEVLADWNTEDAEKVQTLVTKMATHHMETSKEDMGEEEMSEFADAEFWFFPYEILAWLKLRAHLGLPNPAQFDHPLMHLPQAQMPEDTPFPSNELLDKVVTKLIADYDLDITL